MGSDRDRDRNNCLGVPSTKRTLPLVVKEKIESFQNSRRGKRFLCVTVLRKMLPVFRSY